jgi:multisubunit Na+/H+ antiporter MnhB subunit
MENKIVSRHLKVILLIGFLLFSLNLVIARSEPWITEINNQSDYYNVMNQLKGEPQINITNETSLSAEEKESLRIKNNLFIAEKTNTLSPSQEIELNDLRTTERKIEREENKELFIYVLVGLVFVFLIAWIAIES